MIHGYRHNQVLVSEQECCLFDFMIVFIMRFITFPENRPLTVGPSKTTVSPAMKKAPPK